jgi:PhnB protein
MAAGLFPYLHFQGDCARAMAHYAEVFGATDLQVLKYSDAPPAPGQPPMPASDRVMHSQMSVMGSTLMASDFPPGVAGEAQQAVSVMLAPATVDEGRRLFRALTDGGVVAEFGPTFFSPGFGMGKDRFGTHWIIGVAPQAG